MVGCGHDLDAASAELAVEVLVDNLAGPTQFVVDGDDIVVALINGAENDAAGQVVRVPIDGGERRVLADTLDKPTGIALVGDELWIMERDRLTRRPATGGSGTVVARDLPNNGRSQGTLTVLTDGRILFDTSGSRRGSVVAEGSGRLFTIDPAIGGAEPVEYASGFKHAYAHVVDDDGTVWTTEMTDGSFDGRPAADELVAVAEGVDHGWPHCVDNNRVVAEFDGSDQRCADVPASQALFAPSATPTGIAVSPFDDDTVWVALWNERRIVSISTRTSVGVVPVDEVLVDLDRPQHLVAADGVMYLSDFGTGQILRIRESG